VELPKTPVNPRAALLLLAMSATEALLDVCTRRTDVPLPYRLDLLYYAARTLIGVQLRDLEELPLLRDTVAMHLLYPAILSDGLRVDGRSLPEKPRSMLSADQDELAEQWFARVRQIEFDAVPDRAANTAAMEAFVANLEELTRWTPEQKQSSALQH